MKIYTTSERITQYESRIKRLRKTQNFQNSPQREKLIKTIERQIASTRKGIK